MIDAADVLAALHPWNGHSGEPQGNLTSSTLLDSLGAHGLKKVVEEYEKQLLAMLLNECKSLRAAARYAQLDLKTLRDKIAKFDLSQRLKA
jgi:DNA-binding NtrC family response regulator